MSESEVVKALGALQHALQHADAQVWSREAQLNQRLAHLESENAELRLSLSRFQEHGALLSPRAGEQPLASSPSREGGATASMRRVTTNTLRQSRSALGRPLITGRVDEVSELVDEVGGGDTPTSRKAAFRLLVCNDDTCEMLLPNGPAGDIRKELSARSLIKLTWLAHPRTVLIVKKPNDEGAEEALCRLAAWLSGEGLCVLVEPTVSEATANARGYASTWTPEEAASLATRVDFCVCLGGDGTILWAASLFSQGVPPVVSYAMGSLGFLTPFVIEDYQRSLAMVLAGEFQVTLRARLACRIIRASDAWGEGADSSSGWSESPTFLVLNEVVVDRGPAHSLVELECSCDGMPMTTVQADGIIVATPTGSTAYSLAAGGSMVHPGISAMLFTPICAHALSSRPLLLPDGVELRVRVPETSRCTAWAAFDGRGRRELQRGDTLVVRVSPYPVPAVCSGTENEDWFRAATSGLNWNQRTTQKPWGVQLPRSYSNAHILSPAAATPVPTPD